MSGYSFFPSLNREILVSLGTLVCWWVHLFSKNWNLNIGVQTGQAWATSFCLFSRAQGEEGLQGTKGYPGRKGNRGRAVSDDTPAFIYFCVFTDFNFWSYWPRGTRAGRENRAWLETRDIQDTRWVSNETRKTYHLNSQSSSLTSVK